MDENLVTRLLIIDCLPGRGRCDSIYRIAVPSHSARPIPQQSQPLTTSIVEDTESLRRQPCDCLLSRALPGWRRQIVRQSRLRSAPLPQTNEPDTLESAAPGCRGERACRVHTSFRPWHFSYEHRELQPWRFYLLSASETARRRSLEIHSWIKAQLTSWMP